MVVILALDDLIGAPVKSACCSVSGLAAIAQPGGVIDPLYQPARLGERCHRKSAKEDRMCYVLHLSGAFQRFRLEC